MQDLICYSEEVRTARNEGRAIVALESTIISHGMPYPDNISTARDVENIIRQQGAVPATIVIHQGKIHVGVSEDILEHFATDKSIIKASRRDLAYALSQELSASTTVAATMLCAQRAGIDFFVTGGIGGVHRGASDSFDISADLTELGQTQVTVICAGAKAILDIPKTLEVLETLGVPVIGYQSDHFPAFYSHSSDMICPQRANSPESIAKLTLTQRQLNLNNGILVANPIPLKDEISDEVIMPIIEQAQKDAYQQGVTGKALTPYLLQKICELTDGQSLTANIALIKSNALIGAKIAYSYSQLTSE